MDGHVAPSLGALNVSLGQRDAFFLDVGPSQCLASSIGWEPEGPKEER